MIAKTRIAVAKISLLILCNWTATAIGQSVISEQSSTGRSLFASLEPLPAKTDLLDRVRMLRRGNVSQSQSAELTEQGLSDASRSATDSLQEPEKKSQTERERLTQNDVTVSQTGPISGYMDFHFNDAQHDDPVIDFHRFVLLFTHSFSERLRFVSELELEHAVVSPETDGELELEQAYLDFLVKRSFNIRAGLVLAPVGIINERHEPPVFHGVERPLVETVIIPTTWFGAGVGVHGELRGGFRYRVYAMETLDASKFDAEEGLREGRQKGAKSNGRHVAGTGRFEYVGTPGLVLGASVWSGETDFAFPRVDTSVTLAEFDGRYRAGELAVRGLYAHAFLNGMDQLNRAVQRTSGVSPSIASEIRGFYLEGSYFVLPKPSPREVALFLRYENFDTQYQMPSGFQSTRAFDRDAWIVGLTYFPDPDVAVKVDYTVLRNQSRVVEAPNSFNIGLGWWF